MRYKLASCARVLKWSGLLGRCALALCFGLWFRTSSVHAQPVPQQLSVLHAAVVGVEAPQVARVDRALQDTFATQRNRSASAPEGGPQQSVVVQTSPVPFEDVQLIAGCGADETACLQLIANQLGSDALLVRRLVAQPDGRALLTLTAYTTHGEVTPSAPRDVSALVDWTEAQGAERAVQQLLAQLYPPPAEPKREEPPPVVTPVDEPLPEPVVVATPATSQDLDSSTRGRWPSRLGWSAAAVGAGLLIVGVISGAAAGRDERAYARTPITDAPSVDRAHALLDDADRHARVANGLIIGGAVVCTAGLATVLWRWAAERSETRGASLRTQTDRADGADARVRSTVGVAKRESLPGRASEQSTALRLLPSLQATGSGLMLSLHGSWQGGS
ncbi:MAG: hypothetical protein RLZZ450_989 [Pseudomonadota bacterium]